MQDNGQLPSDTRQQAADNRSGSRQDIGLQAHQTPDSRKQVEDISLQTSGIRQDKRHQALDTKQQASDIRHFA